MVLFATGDCAYLSAKQQDSYLVLTREIRSEIAEYRFVDEDALKEDFRGGKFSSVFAMHTRLPWKRENADLLSAESSELIARCVREEDAIWIARATEDYNAAMDSLSEALNGYLQDYFAQMKSATNFDDVRAIYPATSIVPVPPDAPDWVKQAFDLLARRR